MTQVPEGVTDDRKGPSVPAFLGEGARAGLYSLMGFSVQSWFDKMQC